MHALALEHAWAPVPYNFKAKQYRLYFSTCKVSVVFMFIIYAPIGGSIVKDSVFIFFYYK